jgi:hypothetical protein
VTTSRRGRGLGGDTRLSILFSSRVRARVRC